VLWLFVNVTRDPTGTVTSFGVTVPVASMVIVAAIGPSLPPPGDVGEPPPPHAAKARTRTVAIPV
jgi:hypothetical protein